MKSTNFQCKVLDSNDENLLCQAAECLTETFTGIKIGQAYISEPLAEMCKLTKDDMLNFTLNYLKNISSDELCIVAIDNDTSKVIGAIAAENYTPKEEAFTLDDYNNSLYNIFNFLCDLDNKFIEALESKIGRTVLKNEYVHGNMVGVRTELNKKAVANDMLTLLINEASKRGFKALFVEATNFRSQKFNEINGFYIAKDLYGNPISNKYSEDKIFNKISKDVGSECLLMIKPIEENFNLLLH